jgi:hypothetical protein
MTKRAAPITVLLVYAASLPAQPQTVAASAARGESPAASQAVASLPDRLSDAEFFNLVTDISEPGGAFRIADNFTSNELEVGRVFTMLRERGVAGGVYLGVGPEQNLTYIAAILPAMAFVVDIRRQAVMQHLMFKAVFELANDRADFITLLFSKPRPADLDVTTPIQRIWSAYAAVPTDRELASKNANRIVNHLKRTQQLTSPPTNPPSSRPSVPHSSAMVQTFRRAAGPGSHWLEPGECAAARLPVSPGRRTTTMENRRASSPRRRTSDS